MNRNHISQHLLAVDLLLILLATMSTPLTAQENSSSPSQSVVFHMMSEQTDGYPGAPWPMNPYPGTPEYPQPDGSILVDDRAAAAQAQLNQAAANLVLQQAGISTEPGTFTPNYFSPQFDTNQLWLEINLDTNDTSLADLTLHNTESGLTYQIFSATNLAAPFAWWHGDSFWRDKGLG